MARNVYTIGKNSHISNILHFSTQAEDDLTPEEKGLFRYSTPLEDPSQDENENPLD